MYILLFIVLFCAALCDLKYHIIPNRLLFLSSISAISILLIDFDFNIFLSRTLSSVLVFFLFFVFFQNGVLGAGDIKLLMTMCLFLNMSSLLQIIFISFSITLLQITILKLVSTGQINHTKVPMANSLFWGYWLWTILYML